MRWLPLWSLSLLPQLIPRLATPSGSGSTSWPLESTGNTGRILLGCAAQVARLANSMNQTLVNIALLIPLAVIIGYYDVRYRRIPNAFVLAAFSGGLVMNAIIGGMHGVYSSLTGCALAFFLMFMLHVFGAMGAGDVKLFAAIGAVTGAQLVVPTFVVVVLTGGLLAVVSVIRAGILMSTMHRVLQIFMGMLPGWQMPKFAVPADRRYTIPYGVAITMGSLISTAIFRS
jgi:prepilin peptidase CpaA